MIGGVGQYSAYGLGVPWLGRIPEHWDARRLKYAVAFSGGGTPSKENRGYWIGDIPWVSPKDMTQARIDDTEDHITDEAVRESATSIIPAGALVMVVRSGILRRAIPVAINTVDVTLNQDMKALRPKRGLLLTEYLRFLIVGNEASLLREWTKQGATVESIEHELLANTRIPLPPMHEQAAIVRFLDYADGRIRGYIVAKQKLIKLLEEQKQAIVHRAVTRGLDPDVRVKPLGVGCPGEVPEHWEVQRAKFVFEPVDIRSLSGDEELLTVSSRDGVVPRSERAVSMFMAASYVGHKLAWPEDLVINSLWAWANGLGFSKHHGIVSTAYGVYRLREPYRSLWRYLDLALRSGAYEWQFQVRSKGIWKSRLQLTDWSFLDMPVALPPEREAAEIYEHVTNSTSRLSESIRLARGEISLLREYRERVISDVVAGKLDVRDAAASLPNVDWADADDDVTEVLAADDLAASEQELVEVDE